MPTLVNTSGASGVALNGFDAVSFFSTRTGPDVDDDKQQPLNGQPSIMATYQGATYLFASEGHKELFVANPSKYAPQFGGFCALGVSMGKLMPVDISTAQVYKDKLYVNLNPKVLEGFEEDKDDAIAKAEANWPDMVTKYGN